MRLIDRIGESNRIESFFLDRYWIKNWMSTGILFSMYVQTVRYIIIFNRFQRECRLYIVCCRLILIEMSCENFGSPYLDEINQIVELRQEEYCFLNALLTLNSFNSIQHFLISRGIFQYFKFHVFFFFFCYRKLETRLTRILRNFN